MKGLLRPVVVVVAAFALIAMGAVVSRVLPHRVAQWTGKAGRPSRAGVVTAASTAPQAATQPSSPAATEPNQTASAKPGPLAPNTKGQLMILMYHNFQPKEGDWNRTPEKFRADLLRLYEAGYRLVNLRSVLDNKIDLPKGYTPVVLTFDDGWQTQFNYLVNGDKTQVDPDSAVGILLDFAKERPDMGLAGTFYVNAEPFGQQRYWREKIQRLIKWGFEVGNHTYTHANLRQLDAAGAAKEMAQLAGVVKEAAPDYELDSLALPFGAMPHDRSVLAGGSYQGKSYRNRAVLLVGANPAPAPGTSGFDPMKLPRIQANDAELDKWLDYFDRHPEQRYVSDGSHSSR